MNINFLILGVSFLLVVAASCNHASGDNDEYIVRADRDVEKATEIVNLQKEKLATLPDSLQLEKLKIANNIDITEDNVEKLIELLTDYKLKKSQKSTKIEDARVELITQMEYVESLIEFGNAIVNDQGLNIGKWAGEPKAVHDSITTPVSVKNNK